MGVHYTFNFSVFEIFYNKILRIMVKKKKKKGGCYLHGETYGDGEVKKNLRRTRLCGGLLSGNLVEGQEQHETRFPGTRDPPRPGAGSGLTANFLAPCLH